jgi:GNAT superfamily N-acetyltransferase
MSKNQKDDKESLSDLIEINYSKKQEVPILLKIIHQAYKPITSILGRKPRGLLETKENLLVRVKEQTIYSVKKNSTLIGTFTLKKNQKHLKYELQKVAIEKEYQNKGIGSFIVNYAEELVRKKGKNSIIIETYQDHKQLVDFYIHRGYTTIHKRVNKGNVILLMEKSLNHEAKK